MLVAEFQKFLKAFFLSHLKATRQEMIHSHFKYQCHIWSRNRFLVFFDAKIRCFCYARDILPSMMPLIVRLSPQFTIGARISPTGRNCKLYTTAVRDQIG